MAIMHRMSGMSTEDKVKSDLFLEKVGLDDLESLLCSRMLCKGLIKQVCEVMVGRKGREK